MILRTNAAVWYNERGDPKTGPNRRTTVSITRSILVPRYFENLVDGAFLTYKTPAEVRTHFGKLLQRVEAEGRSLVIEKRGSPRAVLLSIRDYVRLALPEPEVLRVIGEESKRKGTNKLGSRQIDKIIRASRGSKRR